MFNTIRKFALLKDTQFSMLLCPGEDPPECNEDGSCPLPSGGYTASYTPFEDSDGVDDDGLAHITVNSCAG